MSAAALVVSALVGVAGLTWAILLHNRLVALENATERAWANVDVALRQRSDEVRSLASAVQAYAAHEKALFDEVARVRATLASDAAPPRKAQADATLTSDVTRLVAVAESYPPLRANESFLALQRRIRALEDILADRRAYYNESVTVYNTRIREVPDAWLARALRFRPKEHFRADA